jgi:hypothetical protein
MALWATNSLPGTSSRSISMRIASGWDNSLLRG